MIDKSRGEWKTAKILPISNHFSISWYKYVYLNAAKIEILILVNYGVELK